MGECVLAYVLVCVLVCVDLRMRLCECVCVCLCVCVLIRSSVFLYMCARLCLHVVSECTLVRGEWCAGD